MAKKIIACLLILIIFNACQSESEKINLIWEKIIHANNANQENIYIAELHQFIRKKQIPFEILFIDTKSTAKDIRLKKENDTITSILIKFDIAVDKQLIKKGWKPIDMENCYYLNLE